jgi:hypothetical protein
MLHTRRKKLGLMIIDRAFLQPRERAISTQVSALLQ